MGVLHARRGLGLTLEPLHEGAVGVEVLVHDLEGDLARLGLLLGGVHGRHAAFAEVALDREAACHLAANEPVRRHARGYLTTIGEGAGDAAEPGGRRRHPGGQHIKEVRPVEGPGAFRTMGLRPAGAGSAPNPARAPHRPPHRPGSRSRRSAAAEKAVEGLLRRRAPSSPGDRPGSGAAKGSACRRSSGRGGRPGPRGEKPRPRAESGSQTPVLMAGKDTEASPSSRQMASARV